MTAPIVKDYWRKRFQSSEGIRHHSQQNGIISRDFIAEARQRKTFAAALAADSVLEIGCGTGELAALISSTYSPRVLRATDLSPEAVTAAAALHPGVNFAPFDIISDWPAVYSGFETVIASNVLEHFDNPWLVADRMLEMGKQALVLVPYMQAVRDGYDGEGGAGHVRRMSRATFVNYRTVDSFTFATKGWSHSSRGEEPLQLAILFEVK